MSGFAPDDKAAEATERIMWRFSRFNEKQDGHILSLSTANYNRVFEAIYAEYTSRAEKGKP